MAIVAYVSGHGFGHSAREVEILRRLPESVPLIVKTAAPGWFWEQELTRPFTLIPDSFDVGCLQTDSLTVDIPATFAAYTACAARNADRRAAELAWLRTVGARVIVTDVASFPLTLAAELGIPGLCVANFTWADIYVEYPGFEAIVAQLESEYAQATLLLEAGLALPMSYFPRRESLGLVARQAAPASLPRAPGERLALIYAGSWGTPFPWERLAQYAPWRFVTFTPPAQSVANLTVLNRTMWRHEAVVAAVDLVISKAGYGIVGECLSAGTPLLYGPRAGFAEFAALDRALQVWPGGLRLAEAAFLGAEWPLERIPSRRAPKPAPGGPTAAASLLAHYAR